MSETSEPYIEEYLKLQRQGATTEALAILRDAIQAHPEDGYLHSLLGGALWDLGKREEALVALYEAVRLDWDLECPRLILAHNLVTLGRHDDAVAVLREGIEECPCSEALWQREIARLS